MTTAPTFARAVKTGAYARIGLVGPDDAAATQAALRIAHGLGGPIGVIDTNGRAASKYADWFDFDTMPLDECDPRTLTWACAAAADAAYRVLIVASLSSFWSGRGGMLEQVDAEVRRAAAQPRPGHAAPVDKNTGWNLMRPHERTMHDALRHFPGHVIVTVRQRVDYVIGVDEAGRAVPRAIGTQPDQAGGWEHHFDLVVTLLDGDTAQVSRSRSPELAGAVIEPGAALAETITKWLTHGAVGDPDDPIAARDWALADPPPTLDEIRDRFYQLDAANQAGTLVHLPATVGRRLGLIDVTGSVVDPATWVVPIGDLLRQRGSEIKAQVERSDATARSAA